MAECKTSPGIYRHTGGGVFPVCVTHDRPMKSDRATYGLPATCPATGSPATNNAPENRRLFTTRCFECGDATCDGTCGNLEKPQCGCNGWAGFNHLPGCIYAPAEKGDNRYEGGPGTTMSLYVKSAT